MSATIIDNFLDKNIFARIQEYFLESPFPWYTSGILSKNDALKAGLLEQDNCQFVHIIYSDFSPQSNAISVIQPIIEKINPLAIVKIKANLNPKTEKIVEHGYHIDYPNLTTAVYYLNTNNGYTLLQDGTKIESVENRLVEFNSNLKHTGTSTTDSSFRIVINFNYIK